MDSTNNNVELLNAHALIHNHRLNFKRTFSLDCAIRLGIPDIIQKHGQPMPLFDLVHALSINKDKANCLSRLMGLLIHSGFFGESVEGYILTPASHLLCSNHPHSMKPIVLNLFEPSFTQPWHQLSTWFKTDTYVPLFETVHGKKFWDFVGDEPRVNKLFNEAMGSNTVLLSTFIAKNCKEVFEGLECLVDVGGGTGTMAKALTDAFPKMSCAVLDLPHVVSGLEGTGNLTYVAGDMFQTVPRADAVLLKIIQSVLLDWPDDECLKILKVCKEAVISKEKGKVIIIEMVIDTEIEYENKETQLFLDMQMMVFFNGKLRTEKDWGKLFSDACFTSYKISSISGIVSLIEVYP